MKKWRRKDTVLVICGAILLVLLFSYLNLFVIPSNDYLRERLERTRLGTKIGPLELSFLEGVFCICGGIFSLIGRGGVNWHTVRTVIQLYIADVLYGSDTPKAKTSKIFEQDLWKSTPSVRTGLSLIIAGLILGALYFLIPH